MPATGEYTKLPAVFAVAFSCVPESAVPYWIAAGFASTIGWPLSAWGVHTIGWRETCFAWAAAHILIGLPINWWMLPPVKGVKTIIATTVKPHIPIDRTMILLAFAFAAAWSVTGAMAAHLPRILEIAAPQERNALARESVRFVRGDAVVDDRELCRGRRSALGTPRGRAGLAVLGPVDGGTFAH